MRAEGVVLAIALERFRFSSSLGCCTQRLCTAVATTGGRVSSQISSLVSTLADKVDRDRLDVLVAHRHTSS
jgi:hypothetical protein